MKQSFGWDAATLNPAQLTLSIHTENLSLGGYELCAWAPVHKVTEADNGRWNVYGPRGVVKAGKVVYATNAYSDALLPELEGLITPMRGEFTSILVVFPTSAQPSSPSCEACTRPCRRRGLPSAGRILVSRHAQYLEGCSLTVFSSLRYLLQHFCSVAPRPDKSIILGTSRGWCVTHQEQKRQR